MDAPTPRSVAPGVYFLEFPVGHVYVWDWGGDLTIVDTGPCRLGRGDPRSRRRDRTAA
jgi:hypothetical protein